MLGLFMCEDWGKWNYGIERAGIVISLSQLFSCVRGTLQQLSQLVPAVKPPHQWRAFLALFEFPWKAQFWHRGVCSYFFPLINR